MLLTSILDFSRSFYHKKFATKLCFDFTVILVSNKRYIVNEIYICRLPVPSLLKSNSVSRSNKRIQNFLILPYKSMHFVFFLNSKKKGFFCLYEKYAFSLVLFLCMIFTEITFCPSIKPKTSSYVVLVLFSYVSGKLRNALPDFIRIYYENLPAFCTAAFVFNEYIFKYYVFSMYLYMLCILAANVMSRRY